MKEEECTIVPEELLPLPVEDEEAEEADEDDEVAPEAVALCAVDDALDTAAGAAMDGAAAMQLLAAAA